MAAWGWPRCSNNGYWSCSCGVADNYVARKKCRGCGAQARKGSACKDDKGPTYKDVLLGPSKREAALQKQVDTMRAQLQDLKKQQHATHEDEDDEKPVDLDKLFRWAQSCRSEWGDQSTEYMQAHERYMRAKDAKQSTKPHSAQLTKARVAREKLEKEEAAIHGEVKRHQKAMQDAQEKLAKKREQLEVAKAKESELKVQDASIKGKGFLTAMQKQYEWAVEGSGISKEEHEHVFAALARVLDNVREEPKEDKDGMDTEEAGMDKQDASRDLSCRQKNKSGYTQVGFLRMPAKHSERGGSRCAPALRSTISGQSTPSRHRQNKFESITLWTFNGSGWGTLKERIENAEGGLLQCYTVQEHRLTGDKIAVVSQSMKAKGYQFGGVEANPTIGPGGEAGTSAGAAVAVPRCIGMTYMFGKEKWDLSPRNSPGRAAAAWLSVGKGIIYATVYLWTAEGMSYRNTEIINKVICQVEALGVPWIIGGDFQVAPEKMTEVESVKMAKARVVASGASCGTCRHAYGVSEIDYFIVADSLVSQVMHVRVQEEWPSAPHKPVGLTLRLKAQERMVRALEKPKKLPELGIGCIPAPPQHREIARFRSQEVANQEWRQYMQTLEQEAFAARGLEWAPDHPAAGRAEEPTWEIKPLSFGGANAPPAAREAVWWRWLARTLQSLQGAYTRLKTARNGDIQRRRQKEAIAQEHQFIITHRRTKHLNAKEQGRWQARCGLLAAGLLRGAHQEAKLQQWMQESQGKMKEHDQKLLKERRARWADRLQEAAAGAGGGLHKLSKAAAVWKPRRAGSMEDSADPIEAAEYILNEWKVVWRVGEQIQKVERPWEREERDKLEPFTDQDVDKLKEVARTFRKKTGVGVDRWHPSLLQGASDEAYVKLLDFYMEVERTLRWPIHMGTVLFFMIPKTYTTDRAIGLLPTAIRAWEIMREPYMVEWAKKNYRSWGCTSYGKAAEDAAWEVLLSHEMDDVEEQSEETQATVTAVLDLVKAFEKVSLHQLKFNTGVLAVVCSYFAMTRRLITETVTTIIAGSKFSVCFLKMVIQSTVDGLVVERPRARWRMYVDDLCARLRQQHRHIVTEFGETIDSCFRGFEELGLKFSVGSKGKGAVMASTKWARRAVTGPMQERGLPVVKACPYLGVDIVTHGTAAKTKSGKRHAVMKVRSRRLLALKGGRKMTKGVGLVYKCGLKRSVMHGCKCLGMPDQIRQLRREAGRLLPGGRGARSLTLQLAVAQEEPTYEVTESPIVRWARAVWHGVHDEDGGGQWDNIATMLQQAWRRQQQEVGMKPDWARVRGPAGAVTMSIRRATWTWPAWHTFVSKEGFVLNMQEVCPMDIAAMVRKDVQATLWEEWTQAEEFKSLSPMPLLAPAVAQLRARDVPKHAKNAAKKVFVGGAWAMEKLCKCNIVPTDICLACGEAVGTEHHRYYKCHALRSQRLQAQADWQHVAEQQDTNMLWTRGLVRSPEADWKFVGVEEDQYYGQVVDGEEDYFTGDIVCDGSKLGYSDWAQTGWAAMSLNDNGTAKMQMWGPLPCSLPIHRRVKRAEMRAFLKVLERMLPPGHVYTDHKGIVEGLQRGERWCTSWKRPHADLWRRIWHKVKGMDLDIHCVKHVKAHRSKSRIGQLEGEGLKIAKGNSEVDLLAKVGAGMDAHYGKHHKRWRTLQGEYKGVPRRRVPKPMLTLTEHDVVEKGGWQVCTRCGFRAASKRMRLKMQQARAARGLAARWRPA
ncbi:unnamed protein product [Prorocentrum cordatum]|uniref:RNase H type-1 domain-containing protein n=1 Tax=Prorocentrum cordatum TaxID=2364126 RepID=A0ABN9UT80_9DINO|nr:unnamed protein product [Polarella glacialis]